MSLSRYGTHLYVTILVALALFVGLSVYYSMVSWIGLSPHHSFVGSLLVSISMLYILLRTRLLLPFDKYADELKEVLKGNKQPSEIKDSHLPELSPSIRLIRQQEEDLQQAALQIPLLTQDDSQVQKLSFIRHERLAKALRQVKEDMKAIALREQQRNWTTQGLAMFVDILRSNQQEISQLGDAIISELVKYLKANQGGLFILSEDEAEQQSLELIACYAYERKKHMQKRIDIGEGLLGQAFLEKDYVYLTDVPPDYVHITSGLGMAGPRSVLIVPLVINEEVYGVIELASFLTFETYQIDFLKKLGESIASTISNARAGAHNRRLLEESQVHAEQMKAQEEEMRQNMEELQATQEEMLRTQSEMLQKEKENERMLAELAQVREQLKNELAERLTELREQQGRAEVLLNTTQDAILYLDNELNIIFINKGGEKMFSYQADQLMGKPLATILQSYCAGSTLLSDYLEKAKQLGNQCEYVGKSNMYGFTFPVSLALTEGEVEGKKIYTVIIRDIRKQKEQEARMQKTVNSAKEMHDQLMQREQDFRTMEKELAAIKAQLEEKDQTIAQLQAGKE